MGSLKRFLVFMSFLAIEVNSFYIDSQHSPRSDKWTYSNQSIWGLKHKDCNGNAQSPIDIQSNNVIQAQLKLQFYNFGEQTRFRMQNSHHSIKLTPVNEISGYKSQAFNKTTGEFATLDESLDGPLGQKSTGDQVTHGRIRAQTGAEPQILLGRQKTISDLNDKINRISGQIDNQLPYEGEPTIKLDWLDDGNNEYKLRDIHFHWGEKRENGSEHAIDGKRASMEMHLVHIKRGLDVSQIAITSDSVAVIGILIDSNRKSNADFNPIINSLSDINATDQFIDIDYKSIYDLLPTKLDSFYTYSGSLTTPSCYQVVNWIIMSDRLFMNAKQLEMFRKIYAPNQEDIADSHDDAHDTNLHLVMPNIRDLQPLNNRTIMASFSKPTTRLNHGWDDSYVFSSATKISLPYLLLGISSFVVMFSHLSH